MAKKNGANLPALRGVPDLPATWEDDLFKDAQVAKASVASMLGGHFLSFEGGIFSLDGQPLARGTERGPLTVVILDHVFVNAMYDGPYVKGQPRSPICFAISEEDADLVPHADAPQKQAERCAVCPHNAFGSGENGKGKACKNGVRVAFATDMQGRPLSPDSEIVQTTLPPTSLKLLASYVSQMSAMFKRPLYGLRTDLVLEQGKGASSIPVLRIAENNMLQRSEVAVAVHLRTVGGVHEILMRPFQQQAEDAQAANSKGGQRRAPVGEAPGRRAPKKTITATTAPPPAATRGARSTAAPTMGSRKF